MERTKYSLSELSLGMSAELEKRIGNDDTKLFADVSGDKNPIHLDEKYASESRYKRRIAHGLHSASFFSALFGTQLPGQGCVYASQTLQFKRAVYVGDFVRAKVEVIAIDADRKMVVFDTKCYVKNKVVTSGTAEIFMPDG